MAVGVDCTKTIILMLLFISNTYLAYGQKYNFRTYSVNDGLPHAQIHDVLQTNDGFIWMATYGGGLTRFDGESFETYTDDHGLPSNAVQKLYQDSAGNLWIAANPGGVVTFQEDSLVNPFPDHALSSFEVYQIKELGSGQLWFGTYEGGIFILENGELTRLTTQDGLISNSIWDFWQDDDGSIWIATQEGISVLKDSAITNYTLQDGLSGDKVYKIAEDHNGNKWMATNRGLTVWDGDKFNTITQINGIDLNHIFDILVTDDGRVWIATETKGLFIFDGEEYRHLTRNNGLSSNYLYALYEDRNSNIWIATNENGVSLYGGEAFVFYNTDFGLNTNEVLSVYIDSHGTIWFGTTEGIESYDGEVLRKHPLPGKYENNYIWEFEELPNGNLLILMPDYTLMEYDGKRYYNFTQAHDLQRWFIYDLYVDSKNVLWIATGEGLFGLNGSDLTHYTAKKDGMVGNVVHYVCEGEDDKLFVATSSGLSILDRGSQKFRNFKISDGLAHNSVKYITSDSAGNIWLGTGGGVSVIQHHEDDTTYTISNFGRKSGMRLVDTHFLWFDPEGYLWQGTNSGLNRLDVPHFYATGNMRLLHYALSDKESGVEFNFKAVAVDENNNAWFGSMNGALKLDISHLLAYNPPKAHITGIAVDAEPVVRLGLMDSIRYVNGRAILPPVTFPYGNKAYTFSFIGLDFRNPENVLYKYKLIGFEDNWMPVTEANSATYTNLRPGDYTFTVQAASNSHNLGFTTASYSFSVDYPFWRTYWFYGSILFGFLTTVYGYTRLRLNILEKRRLRELVEERTRDLQEALAEKEVLIKEIHHRVKNNLAVISGLLELQRGHSDNKFAQRVLLESQLRVQSIAMIHEKLYQNEKLSEIDFVKYTNELIDIISYSFSHLEKEVTTKTCVDDIRLGVDQGIPCGLILNELVSNAYEHAFTGREKGRIEVRLRKHENGFLRLSIIDDGVGLPKGFDELKTVSLGLTLVETLTKQLRGTLMVESSDAGTSISIEFKKEAYSLKTST